MVLNGIDRLEEYSSCLKGKRLGLITTPTGLTRDFISTIDLLHKNYNLAALFSPEHGVRGDMPAGAVVDTYTDRETGIPVYSLYRKDSKRLAPDMLDRVDAVVYDIQDVGARFYTFISTLLYALEDCAAVGKELILFDRLNPLGGTMVEGGLLGDAYRSFIGAYPLPVRYGLTAGEFARMATVQQKLDVQLTVIPCKNWRRDMLFSDTALPWVMPSLGIPTFETALLYPGTCIFEGTNLSEGRGTTAPFHIIGAPFIDAMALANEMNGLKLPGVYFRPIHFCPTASKFKGENCSGVYIHMLDSRSVRSVETGIRLLYTIRRMYGAQFSFLPPLKEGSRPFIDLLCGSGLYQAEPDEERVLERFESESHLFESEKQAFHLYE